MNRNDQDFLVQKIRTQYIEKEHTGLDELKELDTKVKRPANVFAYIFGRFMGYGVIGVWVAHSVLDWAVRGAIFFARYRGDRWTTKAIKS